MSPTLGEGDPITQAAKSSQPATAVNRHLGGDHGIRMFPLTEREFDRVSRLIYRACGIHLKEGKQDLVKARLGRRLRALGLESFDEYFDRVEEEPSGHELAEMVDLLTTNKTEFFRDPVHFEFIRREILTRYTNVDERLRFWCAGCSYGQEPYSLAVILSESFRDLNRRDCKILATDICRPALSWAVEGKYAESEMEGMSGTYRSRYFPVSEPGYLQASPGLRKLILFARLNLIESWPMKGPFQLIMCRNVMIYFDRKTREELIGRFWRLLSPGGFLMVGLSESLTGMKHDFKYVQPAVYCRY
ncbi:MAG: protein-glutamate O-methyltransferase CheR [Acidobacteriota bacterium]